MITSEDQMTATFQVQSKFEAVDAKTVIQHRRIYTPFFTKKLKPITYSKLEGEFMPSRSSGRGFYEFSGWAIVKDGGECVINFGKQHNEITMGLISAASYMDGK
jgi:hypothetical protein